MLRTLPGVIGLSGDLSEVGEVGDVGTIAAWKGNGVHGRAFIRESRGEKACSPLNSDDAFRNGNSSTLR